MPGDGIGKEVIPKAIEVVKASGAEVAFTEFDWGADRYLVDGTTIPPDGFEMLARDFDGFLLKEQVDPDREHIPPLGGYHYTTQSYSLGVFSPREYESEERTRMEQEYERDVDRARQ